jgi:hypothetical protein
MEEKHRAGERSDDRPPATAGDRKDERPAAMKGRLSRGERWVLLAGITLLVLAGVYVVRDRYGVRSQREALLARSAAEAATLSPREAGLLDLVRGFIVETAAESDPGVMALRELSAPGALEVFLSRPGLYFRAAQPDVRPRFLADAARSSPKDAFVLCLLAPPENLSDYDLTVTTLRALPGTPAFEEATRRVQRLDTVQRGLRVLTPGWLDEVKAADPIGLRALEGEYSARTAEEIKMAKAWAAAAYVAIVIDELPAGMKEAEGGSDLAESFRASMLSATKGKPHEARVAIYDIEAKKPVLRQRIRVDAEAFKARTGAAEAEAAQDCYLGATARRLAQQI